MIEKVLVKEMIQRIKVQIQSDILPESSLMSVRLINEIFFSGVHRIMELYNISMRD